MGEYSRTSAINIVLHATLVLICIGFLGCSTVGRVVPAEKRVNLSEAITQEIFKAEGLTVIYSYTLKDNIMSFSCSAAVRFKVQSFNVHLLFLDEQGAVLLQKRVFSSGDRFSDKTLDVPPGAVGISFNYSSEPYRGRR